MTRRYLPAVWAIAAAALVGGAYADLLEAGFVYWDDHALFLDDPAIRAFDVVAYFTDLTRGGYFPLARLSLALDHLAFGYRAAASHAVNLSLHLLNVGLTYRVARRPFGAPAPAALVIALGFGLHPINVEAVSWISGGRKDLLCAVFVLLALGHARRAVTFAAGCGALLTKAMAVTLAPWLIASGRRGVGLALLPFAVGVGLLELSTQRTLLHVGAEGGSLAAAVGRALTGLTFATSRFLWPHDLAVFYDRAALHFDTRDGLALSALAALIAVTAYRRDRRALAGLGWFVLTLAPTLKLVPFGQDSVFNDRYLYLPGIGLLTFVVLAAEPLWRARPVRLALAVIPLTAAALVTHAQTRTWFDQETLWLNVVRRYPTARKAAANLALFYTNENRLAEAEPFARRAIADEPLNVELRSNFGVLLTRAGRPTEARDVYLEARRMAPHEPRLLNNLGYVYLDLKEFGLAAEAFRAAIREAPYFPNPREGLRRAEAAPTH